ncbi:MAG TPA: VOC family protein [Terracidiphilus sp.]|nr:VOC family protein [Terracidiphilus sp.]
MTPRLGRIAPELPAADLDTAVIYYEQKLGFQVAMRMAQYAIVERDGIALHLFGDAGEHSAVGVHIFTPDLEELFAELRASGAEIAQAIEQKPWGNRDFRVRDNFGNTLKFTEPLAE